MQNLEKRLYKLETPILISFHAVADVDAIASGIALQELLKPKHPDLKYISLNTQSKKILKEMNRRIEKLESVDNYKSIVLVDVSDPEMLGVFQEDIKRFSKNKKLITIDHHETLKKIKNSENFLQYRTSCGEIIYDLYKKKHVKVSKQASFLLLLGILMDTHYFREADAETFKNAGELLTLSGRNYSDALHALKECGGEEHARNIIKTIKTTVVENGIAIAKAKTNRTQTASILSEITPIAIVEDGNKISVVQNSSCADFNIGMIMKECAKRFGGNSWGHENIGGCEVPSTEKAVLWLRQKLKQ